MVSGLPSEGRLETLAVVDSIGAAPFFCPECGAKVRDYGRGWELVRLYCAYYPTCEWVQGYKIESIVDWNDWVSCREACYALKNFSPIIDPM